jgi:hypothetical protein
MAITTFKKIIVTLGNFFGHHYSLLSNCGFFQEQKTRKTKGEIH